jgi:zinc/manganese transport system substrate-binding protein
MALRCASYALTLIVSLCLATPARAALRVVASLPDVADMTRQIGGDRVDVTTIAQGSQDPHKVPVRPSFVTKLNRADALVVQGLGLEHAYLPALLEVARNSRILPGAPGYIDSSLYITPLEVPSSQSRTQGELHALGNPHFNMDPTQGKLMARAIAEGLERVDPDGADVYRQGLASYEKLLDEKIAEWDKLAAPLRGLKAVSYHPDLIYLAHHYGIDLVGTIETKAGVPATPGHLEELIAEMKRQKATLVIREVAYELPLAQEVANRTGARVATVSSLTGGLPGTSTYVEFVEANLRALLAAANAGGAS